MSSAPDEGSRTCSKPNCSLCCEPAAFKTTDEDIYNLQGVYIGSASKVNSMCQYETFGILFLHYVKIIFIFY